jgi:hypothetical protein
MSASPRLVWPACNVVAAELLPARAGGRVWPVTASTPRKVHAPGGLATPGATRQPGEQARPTAAPARRRQPHRRSRGAMHSKDVTTRAGLSHRPSAQRSSVSSASLPGRSAAGPLPWSWIGRWSWTDPERQARTGGIPDTPRSAAHGRRSAARRRKRDASREPPLARPTSSRTLTPERQRRRACATAGCVRRKTEDVPSRTRRYASLPRG